MKEYFNTINDIMEDNYTQNQKLAGKPNPKTLIAPIIVPPISDLEYWKANNTVVKNNINEETQTDLYASGYVISSCCGKNKRDNNIKEDYSDIISPTPVMINNPVPKLTIPSKNNIKEDYSDIISPTPVMINNPVPKLTIPSKNNIKEDYRPYKNEKILVLPNEPGWVNTNCGYNPQQIFTSNLPSNLNTGECQKLKYFKNYNKNLFTQNIGKDSNTINQIVTPIQSNIGISFQQQFEPTTDISNVMGGKSYTLHDPRIIEPIDSETIDDEYNIDVNNNNVYDPRFTGYSTSERAYTDNLLGQTKFMYDDIDAIRMPNYISRSNIDHEKFADKYETIQEGNEMGNKYTSNIRQLANQSWLDNSLKFRNDMSERLMRKRNSEMWQRRIAPLGRTN